MGIRVREMRVRSRYFLIASSLGFGGGSNSIGLLMSFSGTVEQVPVSCGEFLFGGGVPRLLNMEGSGPWGARGGSVIFLGSARKFAEVGSAVGLAEVV